MHPPVPLSQYNQRPSRCFRSPVEGRLEGARLMGAPLLQAVGGHALLVGETVSQPGIVEPKVALFPQVNACVGRQRQRL